MFFSTSPFCLPAPPALPALSPPFETHPTLKNPLAPAAHLFYKCEQMAREFLSNFEFMVLLALIRHGDEAYGVPIAAAIEETTGRTVSLGSVYAALDRLEGKELIASRIGDPTPERGGRAKRHFRVTARGVREAKAARRAFTRLWAGLPELGGGQA